MKNLERGSSGEDVERLQQRLQEFGFFEGEITGEFDKETEAAVKYFQDEKGLAADGFVGIITMDRLGLRNIAGETEENN